MKKLFVLLSIVLSVSLISCGYSETDLSEARSEGYKEGYQKGFDDGYSDGLDDGYSDGYDDGYDEGEKSLREIPKPASGEILSGKEYDSSEITVTADSFDDYVVSLKDSLGTEYVSFYVRAGDTVTIGVPGEDLYVYFASGNKWYGFGKGLMFGEDTVYSKDDEALDFYNYTWEYTLYPVYDGNFSETPSDENEFF